MNKKQGQEKTSKVQKTKKTRTSLQQAKNEGKNLFKCSFCKKEYQSYPSLYLHNKIKHLNQPNLTCKKEKKESKQTSFFKMNDFLKTCNKKRDELQRDLNQKIQLLNLKIYEIFQHRTQFQAEKLIGERGSQNQIKEIKIKSKQLCKSFSIQDKIYSSCIECEIFKNYQTITIPISFGLNIVRFFSKYRELATKLYVSLILISAKIKNLIEIQQIKKINQKIWGQLSSQIAEQLQKGWQEWNEIQKNILQNAYSFEQEEKND